MLLQNAPLLRFLSFPVLPLPNRPASQRITPFDAAMANGFYLIAHERMTYLSVRSEPDDPLGWLIHRFVTFHGRLIGIRLPPTAQIFVWPVGQGPQLYSSICCRGRRWGHIPRQPDGMQTRASARRMATIWRHNQERVFDPKN